MSLFSLFQISGSALTAERLRAEVVTSNLANAETTRTPQGGPYQRQMVTFRSQQYIIRLASDELDPSILLVVILDRARANLALARREIRNFCLAFAA